MANPEIEDAEWEEVFDDETKASEAPRHDRLRGDNNSPCSQTKPPEAFPWRDPDFWRSMPLLAKVILAGVPLFLVSQCFMIKHEDLSKNAGTAPAAVAEVPSSSASSVGRASVQPVAPSVPLEISGLSYRPAEHGQCDGETWGNFLGPNEPELIWNPEYAGPATDYSITFHYRYDGRTLHLFDGVKSYRRGDQRKVSVKDRDLTLIRDGQNWRLNGKLIYECAG